jgi:hypothetical protein
MKGVRIDWIKGICRLREERIHWTGRDGLRVRLGERSSARLGGGVVERSGRGMLGREEMETEKQRKVKMKQSNKRGWTCRYAI